MNNPRQATCTVALASTGNTVQLIPAGQFRTTDGRPEGVEAWKLDSASAAALIAKASARNNRFVIDYDHQTLHKPSDITPAAGWFKTLEWREGEGLFATDVEWTATAAAMIKAGEYRYLSPVFTFSGDSGEVLEIVSAGITNTPALDGMQELAALSRKAAEPMAALLGFMQAHGGPDGLRIAGDITALLEAHKEAVAVLSTQTEQARQARQEVSALHRQVAAAQVEEVIDLALCDARLLPGQVEAARRVGATDLAALKTLLDRPALIAALTGMQTDKARSRGWVPPGEHGHETRVPVTREEARIAALTGRTPAEYADLKRRFATEDSGLTD